MLRIEDNKRTNLMRTEMQRMTLAITEISLKLILSHYMRKSCGALKIVKKKDFSILTKANSSNQDIIVFF